MKLQGKVAIVTGAGSGIGRASAIVFAQEGAKVGVVDLNREAGEPTASEIRVAAGASITNMASVLGLVGDPDHVQHSCKSTLEWAECKVRGERIVEREFRITRAGERLMLPVIEEK